MGKTDQWKVIPGFESYEISNTGQIRNRDKLLKPVNNGKGYLKIVLHQDGKEKRFYIHRLVAEAFIQNPEHKPCVNHIDCNPSNNCIENLEWCTHQENVDWMARQGRNKRTEQWLKNLHKAQEEAYVAVVGQNIKTGEEIRFSKLNDVRTLGFQPSCVCNCCQGKRKQHKGYRWTYEKVV
jgi:hypothetical protein